MVSTPKPEGYINECCYDFGRIKPSFYKKLSFFYENAEELEDTVRKRGMFALACVEQHDRANRP